MWTEHKNIMFGVVQQESFSFIYCMSFDLKSSTLQTWKCERQCAKSFSRNMGCM